MTARPRTVHLAAAAAIAALAAALYLPFLGNPLVFDDQNFFAGQKFVYYATHPIGMDLRVPGYFTLAVTRVLSGAIEAQRILSLLFQTDIARGSCISFSRKVI